MTSNWIEKAQETATKALLLLVDDNQAILEGVQDLLDAFGYRVLTAINGQEALRVMRDHTPDLIISDIMMPVMDGYEFFSAVRSNPNWVTIPFIFLTARGQRSDVRLGQSLGADAYLVKPFEPEDLIIAVQGRLQRMQDIHSAASNDVERMKQQLITIFSHELRTPLTYIYGYINLLIDQHREMDTESISMMLNGVHRGAERLFRLVEDLMLMIRIDSGVVQMEMTLRQSMIPLRETIDEILQLCQEQASSRSVTFDIDIEPTLQGACVPFYTRDILSRLIDNAVKFSKQEGGVVTIKSRLRDDRLDLEVIDRGIGIESTQLKTVFELFGQVNRDLMEQQGTGLGLTIVTRLVDLLGGTIAIDSTPAVGTRLTVSLPTNGDSSRVEICQSG